MEMLVLPMACTCEADGIKEAEERRLRIFQRMQLRDMRNLTEAIVISLAFDFTCYAAEVYADQWFGVSVKVAPLERSIFIPCDDPADGFAAVWECLAERFPERVSSAPGQPISSVAKRVSTALLEQSEKTGRTYRDHRDAAHNGPNDCPPCEDCDVLLTLWVSARHTLGEAWGRRSLDTCIEAAFN